MKKVPAMWVGLGVAGLTAGALVTGFGGECTRTICWGGVSPGLFDDPRRRVGDCCCKSHAACARDRGRGWRVDGVVGVTWRWRFRIV